MIRFTLPIRPVTKKNSPRIIWKRTQKPYQIKIGKFVIATLMYRPLIIPSEANEVFEKESLQYFAHVKNQIGTINYPINVKAIFYRDTMRRVDLTNSCEALDDAMVHAELLIDDNRDIIAGHDGSRVYHDKVNPRIEIEITELKDYAQWKNTKDVQGRLEI